MRRALAGLINTPQNNFRVFRNGSPIFGENIDGPNFDALCESVFEARADSRFVL